MNYNAAVVAVLSSYFDQNDYEDPIKKYVGDEDYIFLRPNKTEVLDVKVQQNHAYLADNLLYNFGYEKVSYYSSDRRIYRTSDLDFENPEGGLNVYVSLDKNSEEYERVVYTFLDMFGFIGGLFDFFFFSGFILMNFVVENSFLNDIFAQLYQVRTKDENKTQLTNINLTHRFDNPEEDKSELDK